jgi:hypothetical protein
MTNRWKTMPVYQWTQEDVAEAVQAGYFEWGQQDLNVRMQQDAATRLRNLRRQPLTEACRLARIGRDYLTDKGISNDQPWEIGIQDNTP